MCNHSIVRLRRRCTALRQLDIIRTHLITDIRVGDITVATPAIMAATRVGMVTVVTQVIMADIAAKKGFQRA
jgi:hypothetical protein